MKEKILASSLSFPEKSRHAAKQEAVMWYFKKTK
jgi:hypothetical protein